MINNNFGSDFQRPPSTNPMPMRQSQAPFYDSRYGSYPRRRPQVRSHSHSSHRCRPIVHIIESDSCSSISSCSTISICSRRRHRSCSYSRQRGTCQQQEQPIIYLPVQCQQQQLPTMASSVQRQPFRALPSTSYTNSISMSQPQAVPNGKPQQFQAGPIRYVQAPPQSSSQLQPISIKPYSSIAPQHVLVNNTSTISQATSGHNLPQNDLKFGRHPFDWYPNNENDCVLKDDIQIGRRGVTHMT